MLFMCERKTAEEIRIQFLRVLLQNMTQVSCIHHLTNVNTTEVRLQDAESEPPDICPALQRIKTSILPEGVWRDLESSIRIS